MASDVQPDRDAEAGAPVCLTRQRETEPSVPCDDTHSLLPTTLSLPPTQQTVLSALRRCDRFQLKRIFHNSPAPPIGTMSGEFDAELLDQGNRLIESVVRIGFAIRGTWTGKAFHPIDDRTGIGYNCFREDDHAVQDYPLDTSLCPSMMDGRPMMKIDYRDRNRGLIRWLDGEVRQVVPGIWLGIGMFGPRWRSRKLCSRKIPFVMVGPRRRYRSVVMETNLRRA